MCDRRQRGSKEELRGFHVTFLRNVLQKLSKSWGLDQETSADENPDVVAQVAQKTLQPSARTWIPVVTLVILLLAFLTACPIPQKGFQQMPLLAQTVSPLSPVVKLLPVNSRLKRLHYLASFSMSSCFSATVSLGPHIQPHPLLSQCIWVFACMCVFVCVCAGRSSVFSPPSSFTLFSPGVSGCLHACVCLCAGCSSVTFPSSSTLFLSRYVWVFACMCVFVCVCAGGFSIVFPSTPILFCPCVTRCLHACMYYCVHVCCMFFSCFSLLLLSCW